MSKICNVMAILGNKMACFELVLIKMSNIDDTVIIVTFNLPDNAQKILLCNNVGMFTSIEISIST